MSGAGKCIGSQFLPPAERRNKGRAAPGKAQSEAAALALVKAFLDAIEQRDFERATRCLSTQGFRYVGPTRTFDRADLCMQDLSRVGSILRRIEWRKIFVDGNDVCVIFDLLSTMPGLDVVRIAAWFHVLAGRIAALEVFFDAHPYASMFEPADQ